MGKDARINVPKSVSAETRDKTTVSVYFPGQEEWREQRLAPGESISIDLPSGHTAAVVEVDEDA